MFSDFFPSQTRHKTTIYLLTMQLTFTIITRKRYNRANGGSILYIIRDPPTLPVSFEIFTGTQTMNGTKRKVYWSVRAYVYVMRVHARDLSMRWGDRTATLSLKYLDGFLTPHLSVNCVTIAVCGISQSHRMWLMDF